MADSVFHVGGIEGQVASNAQAITSNTQAIANKMDGNIAVSTTSVSLLSLAPGMYRFGSSCTDKPKNGNGYATVMQRDANGANILVAMDDGTIWSNVKASGTWVGWQQLATKSYIDGVIDGVRMQYFTVSPNTSLTLDYSYVAFIVIGRGGRAVEAFVTYEGTVNTFHANEYVSISAVGNTSVTITNSLSSAMHGIMITKG